MTDFGSSVSRFLGLSHLLSVSLVDGLDMARKIKNDVSWWVEKPKRPWKVESDTYRKELVGGKQ